MSGWGGGVLIGLTGEGVVVTVWVSGAEIWIGGLAGVVGAGLDTGWEGVWTGAGAGVEVGTCGFDGA